MAGVFGACIRLSSQEKMSKRVTEKVALIGKCEKHEFIDGAYEDYEGIVPSAFVRYNLEK